MKLLLARLAPLSLVAAGIGYIGLAQWESARLNREMRDDTAQSEQLDHLNQQMHQRMCQKLNLPEDAVRYGFR